jgi:hypothetical protein
VQFVPLPSYPNWHAQSNEPMLFEQFALKPHGLSIHSLISLKDGNTSNLAGNFRLERADVSLMSRAWRT